jgi:hypothetical protein
VRTGFGPRAFLGRTQRVTETSVPGGKSARRAPAAFSARATSAGAVTRTRRHRAAQHNTRDVLSPHIELLMQAADRLRRPLGEAFPSPAGGAHDKPVSHRPFSGAWAEPAGEMADGAEGAWARGSPAPGELSGSNHTPPLYREACVRPSRTLRLAPCVSVYFLSGFQSRSPSSCFTQPPAHTAPHPSGEPSKGSLHDGWDRRRAASRPGPPLALPDATPEASGRTFRGWCSRAGACRG